MRASQRSQLGTMRIPLWGPRNIQQIMAHVTLTGDNACNPIYVNDYHEAIYFIRGTDGKGKLRFCCQHYLGRT
jgi:hypothetical protein